LEEKTEDVGGIEALKYIIAVSVVLNVVPVVINLFIWPG